MRLLIIALILMVSGCQSVQTVVIVEPQGKKTPKVTVEFRSPPNGL